MLNEPTTPGVSTTPPSGSVAPGRGGQRYHLRLRCKPTDFYEVVKAIEKLNDRAMSMNIAVEVFASAKPGATFVANTMHNLVVEPMTEESEVFVEQESVEE